MKNPNLQEIRLSPTGSLHLDSDQASTLSTIFSNDWREGWFTLAAEKLRTDHQPSLRYWQEIAGAYITQLCHLSKEEQFSPIESPSPEYLSEWVLKAPPMPGGEYLSLVVLRVLWEQLNLWVEQACKKNGDIHNFLKKRAPKWQQVGRVCFHLAENKKNEQRPFAFLATYSTGFNASGKLKHLPLKKALEQYSGEKNRQALVKLLTPVQNAVDRCPWVKQLVEKSEIYQPLSWSANQAYQLLNSVSDLEESGLSVRIPNWWKQRSKPQVSVTIGTQSSIGIHAMLDFNVELAMGGTPLTKEELKELTSTTDGLAFIRGQWVEVDKDKLQEALDHWKNIQSQANDGEISFIEGMRLLAGTSSTLQQDEKQIQQRPWTNISAGNTLASILQQLRDPSLISKVKEQKNLKATLRPYQEEGVNWLSLLSGLGLGACLADDMGLGKTLQILSLLSIQKEHHHKTNSSPSLLVVPASLLGNWKREAEKFTPSLNLFFIHPSETDKQLLLKIAQSPEQYLDKIDLVVTTYSMVVRQEWLSKLSWNFFILDEAQAIKNSGTKQSKSVRAIKSRARIALTGTPIENRLSDLWSLFDFINPGLLGTSTRFKEFIKILESGDKNFESLRKLVSPYILRRMKTDPKIISDLPVKTETPTYCQLTKKQVQCYQLTVDELKQSLESTEPAKRRGVVLQTLLRLKQICNHPSQFSGEGNYSPSESGKFRRLGQICEELASRQEKVLIFTQFSEIIPHIEEYLSSIFKRQGLVLHGGTPIKQRKQLVQDFQKEDGPPFFILSLKAGGTGLTLTAASHVIHFDRWWNPAVENQATDRAFRIGQKKNVQVHKFITQGTVEEEIDKIITSKEKLASDVLSTSDEIKITELPDTELLNLVALDIDRALEIR